MTNDDVIFGFRLQLLDLTARTNVTDALIYQARPACDPLPVDAAQLFEAGMAREHRRQPFFAHCSHAVTSGLSADVARRGAPDRQFLHCLAHDERLGDGEPPA